MTSTHFSGPVVQGEITGNPQTQTIAYSKVVAVTNVGFGATRAILSIPPKSTLLNLGAVPTSAFTGTDPVSAMTVSFGNSAQNVYFGQVVVSANTRTGNSTPVSGASEFDNGGTIVINLSALSTTVFTGGGVRAFVEYVTVE